MTATADLIADAVRAAFAGGYAADPRTVSQDVDVERVQAFDVAELNKLQPWDNADPVAKRIRVLVRANPERVTQRPAPRGFVFVQYPIQVAIAARPKTTENADIDPLKHLSQELRDWFYQLSRSLPDREEVIEGDPELLLDADPVSLQTARLFLSDFIITFSGMRSRKNG